MFVKISLSTLIVFFFFQLMSIMIFSIDSK